MLLFPLLLTVCLNAPALELKFYDDSKVPIIEGNQRNSVPNINQGTTRPVIPKFNEIGRVMENPQRPLDSPTHAVKVTEGGFGEVYKAQINGETVAIKIAKPVDQGFLASEIEINSELQSALGSKPNIFIVPYKGSIQFQGQKALVTKWMENGDIEQYIETVKDS